MTAKQQDLQLKQALCPQCWQPVSVQDDQIYVRHGQWAETGEEPAWCAMSDQPLVPLFPLGQTVMTVGAIEALQAAQQDPVSLFHRHQHGDWGQLDPADAAENVRSVKAGFRILSSYPLSTGEKVWLITEWDRSVSTLLTPSEY